ncbi:MAG: glycosyltransferase [Ruminococcaceae bacterium]|nr:glycosyltransferase [Oscillospiraceae bacterium]
MPEPIISIIIPVYKVEKYLDKCVRSVIGQTYSKLEIILIDDGSPDNCPELCDDYALNDSRIKVIHKPNGGLSSARNAGLDNITGEYIAFLDSDDWLEPETFESMMTMMLEYTLDIVCLEGVKTDGEKELERCFKHYPTGTVLAGAEITKKILLDKIGSQAVQGLYSKKCWENVRFPEGRLYEDIPTTFKAFAKAEKVGFIAEPFYNYRINSGSISNTPNPLTSYHIFLGFKEHFEYAKLYHAEIADECCAKTCHYAVSTYFHYCTDAKTALDKYKEEVCDFLDRHKGEIDFNQMPKTRKLALKAYYFSKGMFKLLCKLFYKSGLQKALHFDIK